MSHRIQICLSVMAFGLTLSSVTAAQTVYWDVTHGTYLAYDIAGNYSSLAAQLTGNGYTVTETAVGLDNENLSGVDVVVVAITNSWTSAYTAGEINAIQSFVTGGGGVFIFCDESGIAANANLQGVASLFGVTCGLDNASTAATIWNSHPISTGMGTLDVAAAGALALVAPANPVGLAGSRVLVAEATTGSGRVAVVGDVNWAINSNFASADNGLFADNTFDWLVSNVAPTCGNGTIDTNEVCDDGNTVNCDGCRADCSAWETGCGDTFVCGSEVCDDGNTADCDGCRGNCSAVETGCGDSFLCGSEVCDDGNTVKWDGCRADCSAVESGGCGDTFVCGSEVCDDGNSADCDGCRGDCSAVETGCGDTFVCGSEVCDDGNTTDCDGCQGDCTSVETGCGDGVVCGAEVCDDGNTISCDGCAGNCSAVETGCGDGVICGAEACDDGNTLACDGCSADCSLLETGCGDGFMCGTEGCDDGNTIDCDGCTANCLPETGCGDGAVCGVEECDDGNNIPGDGCSANCGSEGVGGSGGSTSSGIGGASSSGLGGATSSGSSSGSDDSSVEVGGCGCRAVGQSAPGRSGVISCLALLALMMRRRRRPG